MTEEVSNKRPRSLSGDLGGPPSKSSKPQSSHLQINYLARQYNQNIPLVNVDDNLPSILRLIGDYDGVLHRHESLAGNLGACPLGPILIKRFERLFDGPPRILKSHGKDPSVTWLDVVDFARNKPEQFNLEKMRNGVRVCQFYTKQCRVEISEEDHVLIASGMPQKLIPPQPIQEDEEKELGALEILEKNLSQIVQMADQGMQARGVRQRYTNTVAVSGRARQLNHRLKNRKAAIISRREAEEGRRGHPRSDSPITLSELINGTSTRANGNPAASQSPPMGFTAVNTRQSAPAETISDTPAKASTEPLFSRANTENVTVLNGASIKGISQEQRVELIKSFLVNADLQARDDDLNRQSSLGTTRSATMQNAPQTRSESASQSSLYTPNHSAVPIPSTPVALLPHLKPMQIERDDGGPYKAEMVNRMESLHRGERILPPCDRCRRLHMDCLKNLTACMGCTKKHAKCSWKDVREEELRTNRSAMRTASPTPEHGDGRSDHVESATPDASASSHRSPVSALQPTVQEQPPPSSTSRRELDLLPPPSSLAPALTTSNASPSVYASIEQKSEVLPTPPPPPPPPPRILSAPRISTPDYSTHTSKTASKTTSTIGQQLQDAANGLAAAHRSVFTPQKQTPSQSVERDDDDDEDGGDRLQALATQVYRSASAQQNRSSLA